VFAALVLGVAVMTAVGTLVDRVNLALTGSAAETLAATSASPAARPSRAPSPMRRRDAACRARRSPPSAACCSTAMPARWPASRRWAGYPLRGQLLTQAAADALRADASPPPAPGTAYADPRLLQALGLKAGDRLEFGAGALRIARVLQSEPDASGELSSCPRRCW
jgi:putative ABC transport system permease protein